MAASLLLQASVSGLDLPAALQSIRAPGVATPDARYLTSASKDALKPNVDAQPRTAKIPGVIPLRLRLAS